MLAAWDAPAATHGARAAKVADPAPPAGTFDDRYAFRLPPIRIEAVQESHASRCEQLGDNARRFGWRPRWLWRRRVRPMLDAE